MVLVPKEEHASSPEALASFAGRQPLVALPLRPNRAAHAQLELTFFEEAPISPG